MNTPTFTGPTLTGPGADGVSGWPAPAQDPVTYLTPAQHERLVLVMEECGEVIQACAKVLRFGYDSRHPAPGSPDNRRALGLEIGNLLATISLMDKKCDLDREDLVRGEVSKHENLKKYARHQQT